MRTLLLIGKLAKPGNLSMSVKLFVAQLRFEVLGSRHQLGPQRIALDIAEHRNEMVVILDGTGLEAPLPDVPCGAVMPMVALGVRREQPLHPTSQVAIMMGTQYQVEVVGHDGFLTVAPWFLT